MNKKLSMLLPVIATCGLLAGCGTDYYTKDSTVFVAKNGSVVSTDVEDFDTAAYKQDDLQSYVDKSIDDYNKKNDGSIKLKKLTVEKKKASLTMSYASTDEYTDFNGTKLFSGTIAEALAAGYDFKTDFAAIDDGKAKKCESSESERIPWAISRGFTMHFLQSRKSWQIPSRIWKRYNSS